MRKKLQLLLQPLPRAHLICVDEFYSRPMNDLSKRVAFSCREARSMMEALSWKEARSMRVAFSIREAFSMSVSLS